MYMYVCKVFTTCLNQSMIACVDVTGFQLTMRTWLAPSPWRLTSYNTSPIYKCFILTLLAQ